MNDQKSGRIGSQVRAAIAQIIPAAIVGVVVFVRAVTGFKEMKSEAAAITGVVVCDLKSLASITQNSIHLMLQVVAVDLRVDDLLQKDPGAI